MGSIVKGERRAMAASEIKSVRIDNMEMEYFTFGSGKKPFVMLPGASLRSVMLSKDAVAAAYDMFSKEYTVYVFDMRKNIPEGFTLEEMAADTAASMDELGIKESYMFGCSLGGMIAQNIAGKRSDLVRKLILASTMARANRTSHNTCDTWCTLCKKKNVAALNRSFASSVYSEDFYSQYEEIFRSMENDGTDEEMDRLYNEVKAFENYDGLDVLEKIQCPVLVIGSWDDKILSYEGSIELAKRLDCGYFMYSGYGHAVYDEAPDYKCRIADFFAD